MTTPARRRGGLPAVLVAMAVLAGACGPSGPPAPADALPRSDAPPAPPPVPEEQIPPTLSGPPQWQSPFSSPPKSVEDGFVGLVMPEDDGGDLTFLGVGTDGETHWATERNPSCTAFAVTRASDGRELVVLLDSDADHERGALATRTTAAAYDPSDGTLVWGPVEVPGTLVGPGLVFASIAGSIMSSSTGPKTALDPATGRVVAAEEETGGSVHQEHHGVVLTENAQGLRAVDASSGTALWEADDLSAPESIEDGAGAPLSAHYGPRPETGTSSVVVVEWRDEHGDAAVYTVHDIRTGHRITEMSGSAEPSVIGTVQGQAVLRGASLSGQGADALVAVEGGGGPAAPRLLWSVEGPDEGFRMEAIVNGVLYLVDGTSTRALDMSTGRSSGEGTWSAPVAAAGGIALVPVRTDGAADAFAAVPGADRPYGRSEGRNR